MTRVLLKSCSFRPLPWILIRGSLSLISGASLFLSLVKIRFWAEKVHCCVEKCRQRSLRAVQSQDFFRRHEANRCKYIQSDENARTLLENESTWNSEQ